MRIGELAAIAGVTTRTVRYYHRVGVLPEPERQLNGYRDYGLREAVALVRVRRLVELGLSLDEVRDALSDDSGKDLYEALAELDADLARQQDAIRRRRARLAELLKRAEAGEGLPPEGPVSAELAAIFDDMARADADREGPESAMAAKDRELLALLEASASPGHREWFAALTHALNADPEAMDRAYEIYARLDELAGIDDLGDPRIAELAEAVAHSMPEGLIPAADTSASGAGESDDERASSNIDAFAEAFFADFPPAQAEVLRRAVELLRDRGRS
jgi:DNA-binding transcriptional MerR regulator